MCGIIIIGFFNGCSLFKSADVSDEVPLVMLATLSEIKELPKLDTYGFIEDYLLTESSVKRNESLFVILRSYDVSPQVIYEIERVVKDIYPIRSLRENQEYRLYRSVNSEGPTRMILHEDRLNYLIIDWEDKVWAERQKKETYKEVVETTGIIASSLYKTLKDNGVNPLLGNKLSDIYGWQIDFFALQVNDSYKVIYEQEFVDGKPYGVGEILAAQFVHKGEAYDAYFYETEDRAGYFNRKGEGLQKALLKAPFKYSQRVSSGFSHNRLHPVLGRNMPHYGVDYAAPLGTPVIAVGEGEVIEARYRGPNGNIVKIKHNSVYTTAYLHLNGFAPGIRAGEKVKQGQVIGYVGRTGRVTGVHLDYRIYKNNQPINPLTINLPPSEALKGAELEDFKLYIERYRFQLRQINAELFAFNS